jgi:hypothetical protein
MPLYPARGPTQHPGPARCGSGPIPMLEAFRQLPYLVVLAVTFIGFFFGALWYSVLFKHAWAAEMKLDPTTGTGSMGPGLLKGFIYTFISTLGIAWIIELHPVLGPKHGAAVGLVVGLLIVGARYANSGIWERKSCKLIAINVGHEVLLFVLQGAILGRWLWR